MNALHRRRGFLLVLLPMVIALGLASRRWPIGVPLFDSALGDALYAAAAYLAFAILLPGWRPIELAILAGTFCLAIELFKLTGYPYAWRRWWWSRVVFGTTFGWHNVPRYAAGIACAALIDALVAPRRARR